MSRPIVHRGLSGREASSTVAYLEGGGELPHGRGVGLGVEHADGAAILVHGPHHIGVDSTFRILGRALPILVAAASESSSQ